MKAFVDTSVLVPVFYKDHLHHRASMQLFLQCDSKSACCGAHTLAELYATLTRMPGKRRVSSDHAMLLLESLPERFSLVALASEDYLPALQAYAALGISGGSIYDALLAHCAIKAQARTIYTWNLKHFARLGQEVAKRLRTPEQMPS